MNTESWSERFDKNFRKHKRHELMLISYNIKQFISIELTKAREDTRKECVDKIDEIAKLYEVNAFSLDAEILRHVKAALALLTSK